jgi:hypothetical protein
VERVLRLKEGFQQSRFSERVIIAAPRLRKFQDQHQP